MSNWTLTENVLPDEGRILETISPGGQAQDLVLKSGLWWFPDMSMYVYYVPWGWRYKEMAV